MTISNNRKRVANIEYEYDPTNRLLIFWQSGEIHLLIWKYLHASEIKITSFDKSSNEFHFNRIIELLTMDVFDGVEYIKKNKGDEYLALQITNYLFECFTNYWVHDLLEKGKISLGILFWHELLKIIDKWEKDDMHRAKIHKGTPYYFLAENYLLLGDRDFAFTYLFNALEEDRKIGNLIKKLNYPLESPAFLTSSLRNNQNNHMFPLVSSLRSKISEFINKFNNEFSQSFSIEDFDTKFLKNESILDLITFFVYNFLYIFESEKVLNSGIINNDFSKLKTLDLFFNLSLLLDEILKVVYLNHNKKLLDPHYISESIFWLCNSNGWMPRNELQNFLGKKYLNFRDESPNNLIPKLLMRKENYNGNPVSKEVFVMLLAYKLRNFGGHKIEQQYILTKEYDNIISNFIYALFFAIQKLN